MKYQLLAMTRCDLFQSCPPKYVNCVNLKLFLQTCPLMPFTHKLDGSLTLDKSSSTHCFVVFVGFRDYMGFTLII